MESTTATTENKSESVPTVQTATTENGKQEAKITSSPIDAKDQKKLQAMLGNPKEQKAEYVLNQKGQKGVKMESHSPQATIYFKGCDDCEFFVESLCTKVLIESCNNCTVTFNKKIVTNTVDVWKCENVELHVNTPIGTLQADMCKKLKVNYAEKSHLNTLVWAGVHDLHLSFKDADVHNTVTGFSHMKEKNPSMDLKEDLDQFIMRFIEGELLCEQIVRLQNGYPTTEREAKAFDARHEENLQKLAQAAGITIGKKKKDSKPKPKPNDPCTCSSGKKYKKCCALKEPHP